MRLHHFVAIAPWLLVASARGDDAPDAELLPPVPFAWKALRFTLDGYLRARGGLWHDLDLSRGPTPSTGEPIFPRPAGGEGQLLTGVDTRIRVEPTLEVGQAVRLKLRLDLLDNLGWGSTPDVLPSYSRAALATSYAASPEPGQNALQSAVRIKQAWGEVVLPFGVLSVGRMGALVNWGTGFFVNNGACASCDYGDSGDRVALTLPLWGHWLTALYELSASGPQVTPFAQPIDLEPRAHVDTFAVALSRFDSPEAQRRRLRAGRTLVQYGLLASYRRQELDAPGWTRPGGLGRSFGPSDFVRRGLDSFAADLWLLVHHGGFRAELEAATVVARIADASLQPGVALRRAVTSVQWGGVANVAYAFRFPMRLRLEVGVASGDDAPGFGVRAAPGQIGTTKGDFDGPQVRPPGDTTLDNFRFHPDYRADLILWRRIVGQVTDAVYIRPSIAIGPFGSATHGLVGELAVIQSRALFASSTPGQDGQLGVELDALLRYRYDPAFEISLQYGLLLPGAGFKNRELALDPQPAQALELILLYRI